MVKNCVTRIVLITIVLFIGCKGEKKPEKPKTPLPTDGVLTTKEYVLDYNSDGFEVYRYKDGRFLNGTFSIDFEGKIFEEVSLKNGLLHGEYKMYKENGKLGTISNYANGKKEGITKKFFDDGRVKGVEEFKNNKLVKETFYDQKGLASFVKEKIAGKWVVKIYKDGKLTGEEFDKVINKKNYAISKFIYPERNAVQILGFELNDDNDGFNEQVLYLFNRNYKLIDSIDVTKDRKKFKDLISNKNFLRR